MDSANIASSEQGVEFENKFITNRIDTLHCILLKLWKTLSVYLYIYKITSFMFWCVVFSDNNLPFVFFLQGNKTGSILARLLCSHYASMYSDLVSLPTIIPTPKLTAINSYQTKVGPNKEHQ